MLLPFLFSILALHIPGTSSESFDPSQPPPDISKDGVDAVKAWARDRTKWATHTNKKDQYPSPSEWSAQIVYSIQVDRFNNGNLTNDMFNLPESQREHQNSNDLFGLSDYRHGGDLQGIIDRLGYVADLGVTALWITPILKHDGAYHGYCTTDLMHVDPGFGSDEDLVRLVQEAHKHGIYVIMDVVVNHLCGASSSYSQYPTHGLCADELAQKYWDGADGGSDKQGTVQFGDDFFPPFKSEYFFNRCGPNSIEDTSGEGSAAIFGDFVEGMFDYDTRNYDWQEIFTELHNYWISYADIDGFRLDAAKHVTDDFIAYFSTTTRKHAKSLGKNNFFVVGEVAASAAWQGERVGLMFSDPHDPSKHGKVPLALTHRLETLKDVFNGNKEAPYPGLTAIYQFELSGTSRDVLLNNKPPVEIAKYLNGEDYKTVAAQQKSMLENWGLLEIHDWPRYLHKKSGNTAWLFTGLALLFTQENIPVIYYGLEQGFNGICHLDNMNVGAADQEIKGVCSGASDSCFRQDMFMSGPWRLGSIFGDVDNMAYIGVTAPAVSKKWTEDPMLNTKGPAYIFSKKLIKLRKTCPALTKGITVARWMGEEIGGIISYSRIYNDMEIMIIIKPADSNSFELSKIEVDARISHDGQKFVNVFNNDQVAYVGAKESGSYLFFNGMHLNQGDILIFIAEEKLDSFDPEMDIRFCK